MSDYVAAKLDELQAKIDAMSDEELVEMFKDVDPELAKQYAPLERWLLNGGRLRDYIQEEMKQDGFTTIECLVALGCLLIYVAIHFIAKFW